MRSRGREGVNWRSLSGTSEFSRVYEEGVKYVGRLFVLYLYPGDDFARGVVASRKVGDAVRRNRAKRLLREAIRERIESSPDVVAELQRRHWPANEDRDGLWFVLVARRAINGVRCGDVIAELTSMLQRSIAGAPSGNQATTDRPSQQ